MNTAILEKKIIGIKKIDLEKNEKEFFLSENKIKEKLDKMDEYYKTHEFVWTEIKEAYFNWLKELKLEYGL